MRSLLCLVVLFAALSGGTADAEERPQPEVGKHYPPLRLPTIDGKQTIDLRQFIGKKVLLIEFASW